ncbi:Calpain [Diplonema papillatum]|nr:Calpain [Diplonema papillatum]|eukprot:gene7091-10919_t
MSVPSLAGLLSVDEALEAVRALDEAGEAWEDAEFRRLLPEGFEGADYVRVGDAYPGGIAVPFDEGKIGPDDVEQGTFPDCFLCASMAALAKRPSAVAALFLNKQPGPSGALAVQFYHSDSGGWRAVVVDDRIPLGGKGKPLFARATRTAQAWPLLVEKAYAKLYGSFASVRGGSLGEALRDLTGCPVLSQAPKDKEPCPSVAVAGTSADKAQAGATGLTANHAFSLVAGHQTPKGLVLQFRDPQAGRKGGSDWKGAFAFGSRVWQDAAVKKAIPGVDPKADAANGRFYCPAADVSKSFESFRAVPALPQAAFGHRWARRLAFGPGTDGGNTASAGFKRNAVVKVSSAAAAVFATLTHADQRGRREGGGAISYPLAGFTLLRAPKACLSSAGDCTPGTLTIGSGAEVVGVPLFQNARDVCAKVPGPPPPRPSSATSAKGAPPAALWDSSYLLVPSTSAPAVHFEYELSLVSTGAFDATLYSTEDLDQQWASSAVDHAWDRSNKGVDGFSASAQWRIDAPAGAADPIDCVVTLRQGGLASSGVKGQHQIAVLVYRGCAGVAAGTPSSHRIGTPVFSNAVEVSQRVTLRPKDFPCTVIPVTSKPGDCGAFSLTVFSPSAAPVAVARTNPAHAPAAPPGQAAATATRTTVVRRTTRGATTAGKPHGKLAPPASFPDARNQCTGVAGLYGGLE